MPDVVGFRADVDRVPETLISLAAAVDKLVWPIDQTPRRLLLLGMGSSHYAADVFARHVRTAG
jgi:fructoselysine-6-P-deglycase FrlB-like protein